MSTIQLTHQSPAGLFAVRVGSRGAQLISLTLEGVEFIQPVAQGYPVPWSAGIAMAPWVNRIEDGEWSQGGKTYSVPLSEPKFHNAIHGFVSDAEFELIESGDNFALLQIGIPATTGYPFLVRYQVEYRVTNDGLVVTHRALNLGKVAAPFATGAHPYFVVGKEDLAAATIVVPAATIVETDDRLLPTQTVSTEGHQFDLRVGRNVGQLRMDNTLGGLQRGTDGLFRAQLRGQAVAVEVWQGAEFNHCHIFVTDQFSGPFGKTLAIAIEPTTGPANNFNSGTDLLWLSPEVEWSGSWGIGLLNL